MKHSISKQLHARALAVLALVLMCLNAQHIKAQVAIDATNFPDQYFRAWVLDNYNDGTGHLDAAKAATLTKLNVLDDFSYWSQVTSLKGIEYFTELTQLDFSKTKKLTSIDVSSNVKLTRLNVSHQKLTSLDVTANTALKNLDFNDNDISEIDLSNNRALIELVCTSCNLTELDLSNNSALKTLSCS